MEVITNREIIYNSSPELEAEMIDKYSYFPDKPETPSFLNPTKTQLNFGNKSEIPSFLNPTKTQLNIPEFKLIDDKKDTVISQLKKETFRNEIKPFLKSKPTGTKKPIVNVPKIEETTTTEKVEVIPEKQGMSLGAKIGIGVGILAILGLGIYLIKKNK